MMEIRLFILKYGFIYKYGLYKNMDLYINKKFNGLKYKKVSTLQNYLYLNKIRLFIKRYYNS